MSKFDTKLLFYVSQATTGSVGVQVHSNSTSIETVIANIGDDNNNSELTSHFKDFTSLYLSKIWLEHYFQTRHVLNS